MGCSTGMCAKSVVALWEFCYGKRFLDFSISLFESVVMVKRNEGDAEWYLTNQLIVHVESIIELLQDAGKIGKCSKRIGWTKKNTGEDRILSQFTHVSPALDCLSLLLLLLNRCVCFLPLLWMCSIWSKACLACLFPILSLSCLAFPLASRTKSIAKRKLIVSYPENEGCNSFLCGSGDKCFCCCFAIFAQTTFR